MNLPISVEIPSNRVIFSLGLPTGLLPDSTRSGLMPVVFQLNTVLLEEDINIPNKTIPKPICPIEEPADFNFAFCIVIQKKILPTIA